LPSHGAYATLGHGFLEATCASPCKTLPPSRAQAAVELAEPQRPLAVALVPAFRRDARLEGTHEILSRAAPA
jgi:hypothetical protein